MRKIIGFTGAPQTGKTELRDAGVFDSVGLIMVNLNNVGNDQRRTDSELRPMFDELVPGLLYDDGRRHATFYNVMSHRPEQLERFTALEERGCRELFEREISGRSGIVVNWEYLYRLLRPPAVHFDHIIVLDCLDRVEWRERNCRRAMNRHWQGEPPTGEMVAQIIAGLGWDPDFILAEVRRFYPEDKISVVDSSGPDWGEANLRAELARLGWR